MKYNRAADNENETSKKILDTAYQLFIKNGYRGVTNRDIAAAADVNLGLITYYFGSKENLANRVLMLINDKAYARAFSHDLSGESTACRLYVYTELLWQYFDSNENRFAFEMVGVTRDHHISDTFYSLSLDVIQQYKLDVSPAENEVYMMALKGAEITLIAAILAGELDLQHRNVTELVMRDYFFNIGLDRDEIANIITRSKQILKEIGPKK